MTNIHPTAIVEDGARLGADVSVGPYSFIGRDVALGDGVVVHNHASITGNTVIGVETSVHPFASIGGAPQSVHYKGVPGKIVIGEKCILRENVTVNFGTVGEGLTQIGDRCFLMTAVHIAHDCVVGNDVIMANCATIGGHATIGDYAFLGGVCAVHQFARIGAHTMVGGLCPIWYDLIPFGVIKEASEGLRGLNIIGLRRRGFDKPTLHALRAAYRELFFGPGRFEERINRVAVDHADDANVMQMITFVRQRGKRRLTVPRVTRETVEVDE
jgi:UDP-N-acetylglucosamine acyltransferase